MLRHEVYCSAIKFFKMLGRKLLRSVLFTPGDKLKALEKSLTLPTDAIIIDLEDAVSPSNKKLARDQALNFIGSVQSLKKENRPYLILRTNCPERSPWGSEDIQSFSDSGVTVDGVLLPKVDNADLISRTLDKFPKISSIPLWANIETCVGVQNADSIMRHPQVEAFVFGINDLSKELGIRSIPLRHPLIYSLSKCVLAARAAGKIAIDGVYMDLKNIPGLEEECRQGRDFGFHGKSLIHPNQIEASNQAFSPSEKELEWAREITLAYKEAMKEGKGVCVVRDRLVEHLHVIDAQNMLEMQELIVKKSKNL